MFQARATGHNCEAQTLPDLHLCNNYRHLLISLASIAAQERAATVVYLEDVLPLPVDMLLRLAKACPQANIILTRDIDQIAAFARLPAALPTILRRNLTLGGRFGLQRPRNWHPPLLAGQLFATGFFYHSGFFLSKAVAGLCCRVVLRESGLNNYTSLRVSPLKALLRLGVGLPPFRQSWGEEPWVDALEMSHPEDLPAVVRHKAQRLTFADVLDVLAPATARRIAAAFLGDLPQTNLPPRSALLLTQPISEVGICGIEEQQQIYVGIAKRLKESGYTVYVKPHPLDHTLELPDVYKLPGSFPIEAWPYFSDQKFSLAVALCSSSLTFGARVFAHHNLQLLAPKNFNANSYTQWPVLIEKALAVISD